MENGKQFEYPDSHTGSSISDLEALVARIQPQPEVYVMGKCGERPSGVTTSKGVAEAYFHRSGYGYDSFPLTGGLPVYADMKIVLNALEKVTIELKAVWESLGQVRKNAQVERSESVLNELKSYREVR